MLKQISELTATDIQGMLSVIKQWDIYSDYEYTKREVEIVEYKHYEYDNSCYIKILIYYSDRIINNIARDCELYYNGYLHKNYSIAIERNGNMVSIPVLELAEYINNNFKVEDKNV